MFNLAQRESTTRTSESDDHHGNPIRHKKKASHETNPQVTPGGDHPTHDLFQWDQPTWLACSPSKS